jgi:hypothetical protein
MVVGAARFLALLSVIPLAACSTLPVTRVVDGPNPPLPPIVGQDVYWLPRTKIGISGTIALTKCEASYDRATKTFEPALGISETFAAVPVIGPDPDAGFAIPLAKTRTPFKEVNITLNYGPGGTLGGFNGTYNDEAGPTALAAVLAAVKIAAGVTLPVVPHVPHALADNTINTGKKHPKPKPKPPAAPKGPAMCAPDVMTALDAIKAANAAILTAEADAAKNKLTLPTPQILELQGEIARLQLSAGLVRTFSYGWLPVLNVDKTATPATYSVTPLTYDVFKDYVRPLLSSDAGTWFDTHPAKAGSIDPIRGKVVFDVQVEPATIGDSLTDKPRPAGAVSLDTPGGLVLRLPATGHLRICRGDCSKPDAANNRVDTSADLASSASIAFSQFGRFMVMPLKNRLFETSTLAVSLNPDGTIASIGNHATGTLGTNLGTAGSIGDALSTAAVARNTVITARNTAELSAAQFPDLANKALGDCYVAAAAAKAADAKRPYSCE